MTVCTTSIGQERPFTMTNAADSGDVGDSLLTSQAAGGMAAGEAESQQMPLNMKELPWHAH